jgi:calcium-dependent protein kinase
MGASILNNSNTIIKYQTSTFKTQNNVITQTNIKKVNDTQVNITQPPTKSQRRHSVIISSVNKLSLKLPPQIGEPTQSEIKEEEEDNVDDGNQNKNNTQISNSNTNNNEVNTNINNNTQDNQNQQQKFMRKGSRSISLIQKNKLGSNIFKEELKLKVTINAIIEENKGLPTMKYKILSRLGDGSYGTVYLAMNIMTKTKVALKKIKKVKENEVDDLEIKNEIDILKKLDHPNVVKILEFYTTDDAYYIITDYCQCGELYNQIKYKYNENQLAVLFYQVFSGLCYLHQFNIVHRDLKLENILISEIELDEQTQKKYFWIKIIDFGTAKIFEKNKSEKAVVGSSYYIAPEVLKKAYNEKCDTWSAGVLLYMILVGRAPFDGEDDDEIIEKIEKGEFNRNHRKLVSASPEIQDLVNKLLEIDPSVRLSAAEALKHPWFKKFNGKSLYMNIDEKKIMKYLQRLMNYEINTKFEQMVHAFIVHNIPPSKESKDILKIFRVFNTNDDCKLSKKELEEGLLKYFSKEKVEEKINDIFLLLDGANHGYIEYEEFLRACLDKTKVLCKENLVYAFNFFDKDNSGKITVDKVKAAFSESNVSEEVFENIFREICLNENGELDFTEFQDVMFGSSSQQK